MYTISNLNLQGLQRLAVQLAALGSPGDCICLNGDLGAGKSQFARFFVRGFLEAPQQEVPSPSYGLVISYDGGRCALHHYDFYRLGGVDEAIELNVEEQLPHAISLIEWGENIPELLPQDRLQLNLSQGDRDDERHVTLCGYGTWIDKLSRYQALRAFLSKAGQGDAVWSFLTGDASSRSYIRLRQKGETYVLMNAPRGSCGPVVKHGKTYSQLVHLAEDMRPFVAVGEYLYGLGVHVPKVHAHDLAKGFLLLDDLGSDQFGPAASDPKTQKIITKKAVDLLVQLGQAPLPPQLFVKKDDPYDIARYDRGVLQFEADLTLDYYWRLNHQKQVDDATVRSYHACWAELWDVVETECTYTVLRDFHSPNLLLLGKNGDDGLGVIDYQDALAGHRAYDLVSLLQDARIDVAKELEDELLAYYCDEMSKRLPDFVAEDFIEAYRILGAQRSAKLLGIFVRLCVRDGKPHYLEHLPRVWDYMQRNLVHPRLKGLKAWFDQELPPQNRNVAWIKQNLARSAKTGAS